MLDRPGYTIRSTLHEGFQTIIYRLQIPTPPNSAILKLLKLEDPPLEAIARLKHEYQIQKNFNDSGIVKAYRIDTFDGRLGLLLEDLGGISLKQILFSQKMSIASFLNVAVQLVKALISVQQHQIIHKDIKPANIIINPTSGIVKLTDFSIASVLIQETSQPIAPDHIAGTLAYISPEQTGRINRTLDYRSDFYSLGVTFYEMLTGKLPFQSNDPLEIIYCHLSKQPVPMRELNSEVPEAIAQIVEKMMAKNADDRYQTAAGILADLQHCFDQLKTTGKIEKKLMNLQYKYDLVEAERCRMLGQTYAAMELYDRAIQGAAENGYIEAEAFANEIAAKFYLELGKKKIAKAYMTDAYLGYDRSGDTAKAKYLVRHYPDLIFATQKTVDNSELTIAANSGIARTTSSTTSSRILDLVSVMKASETIQSEITSDNLPRTLLHILLESAGAQKGCLILEKNDRLFVEAIDNGQELREIVLQSIPIENSKDVPISLIDYVAQTQQPTVLHNLAAESIYQTDPYIQQQQPKSAVCAPIFYQGKLIGIFYLENNLVTNAFTIARLELLELLASQVAIALKNARLYACEQEKSKQLQQSLEELQQTQVQLAHQKEQYLGIFEAVTDGIYISDLETGKIVEVNPAVLRIYGYTYDEFVILSPTDYVHYDSLHLFASYLETLQADKHFHCHAVNMRKDGTLFDIEVFATTCTYNGKRHGLAILRDISDRKRAEYVLQQQEAQYRSIFEAANDGLAICDLETSKFIDANPANCRMYGYELEEWLNLAPTDYIHPDSLYLFGEFIQIVQAGEDFCCEAVMLRKDGTPLEVEVRATPYTYNGKPHALCIVQDISDRKRAEQTLRQSEQRFRNLFQATPKIALQGYDRNRRVIAWNRASELLYGYTCEEAIGKQLETLIIPPAMQTEMIQAVENSLASGVPIPPEEIDLLRKDGSTVSVYSSHIMLTNSAGELEIYCIDIDLSDRKKAENALRHSETQLAQQKQTLKAILNAAPIWIWMTNLNGKMQFVNKTLCANVGIPVSRFIEAEHYREVLGEEIASNCIASDNACMAQETPHFSVELLPFVDEQIHYLEVTKAQIKDPQGQKIGIIGLGVDATDRTQAKFMLQEKNQHLEEALQELQQAQTQLIQNEKMSALGNLVAGVAHEINNPIGFLNGSINNIEEYIQYIFEHLECYQRCYPEPMPAIEESAENIDLEFLIEDFPKIFNSMKVAVDRIHNISTSLRTFSRADSDRKIACNIHEGIDSTLLILKYRLKANEQRPEIKIVKQYGDLPLVECFSGQLNQVFMNILANAIDSIEESIHGRDFAEIKANPNTITVTTEVGEDNQTVVIKIKDSGKGMSEEVKARIFNHLFTTKGVGKGTGLGLSISREIVEETHEGSLICNSVLGEGTEFAIALPLGRSS
jgi:PAS domain S-box-containing protein